jgi:hypothetical protein
MLMTPARRISKFSRYLVVVATVSLTGCVSVRAQDGQTRIDEGQEAGRLSASEPERNMSAMREQMQSLMQEMDSDLAGLVAEMGMASEGEKTEAIAAVLAELTRQRETMSRMLAEVRPIIVTHIMAHMAEPSSKSMVQCSWVEWTVGTEEESEKEEIWLPGTGNE